MRNIFVKCCGSLLLLPSFVAKRRAANINFHWSPASTYILVAMHESQACSIATVITLYSNNYSACLVVLLCFTCVAIYVAMQDFKISAVYTEWINPPCWNITITLNYNNSDGRIFKSLSALLKHVQRSVMSSDDRVIYNMLKRSTAGKACIVI